MFCYIFYISSALLITSNLAKTLSFDSSEEQPRKPTKIDLNALKNAAEVVKVLKEVNERGIKTSSLQRGEGYGNQAVEALQGIDIDYLGITGDRDQKTLDLMELMQKNYNAQENRDLTRSERIPRVYIISNPEVLEEHRHRLKRKKERLASAESPVNYEKGNAIAKLLKLLKNIRRDGEPDNQNDGPNFTSNNFQDDDDKNEPEDKNKDEHQEYVQEILNNSKEESTRETVAFDNADLTKMPSLSWEATEKSFDEEIVSKTTMYPFHVSDDDTKEKDAKKKHSWDSESDESDKRITIIDFKAHKTQEDIVDEKSAEQYKGSKKKQSKYDDDTNDEFKKKRNKWDKEDDRGNEYKKKKNADRKPYERPRPKPQISRPRGNKVSKNRDDSVAIKGNFHPYGRTPVPIVGKRGIYEDE